MHTRSQDLVAWLRSRLLAAGADGLAVPLRDTVESGVVARLSQLAAPDRVLGVVVRGEAGQAEGDQAILLASHLRLPTVTVDATGPGVFDNLQPLVARLPRQQADDDVRVMADDLAQRLRMAILYFVAGSQNYLTAGTLDKTDLTLGTFVRYGDAAVDLLPLGSVLRREVLALAADLELPAGLREAALAADAERRHGGVSHHHLEHYIAQGPDAVAPAVALKIERLMRESERKRTPAAVPESE